MKLICDSNKVFVFLNKLYIEKKDFEDKRSAERFLRELFLKLKHSYNLDFNGYYDITLYVDKIYGVVISIEKEELEYFDYFDGQIEMSIKIVQNTFLYELSGILDEKLLEKFIIYNNKDAFYLKPKKSLSNIEMGILLENVKVIFDQKVKEILRVSSIVKG